MEDLSKTHMKAKVRSDILKELQKLTENLEHRSINGVPMRQEAEYKEVFEKEVERVFTFLGF